MTRRRRKPSLELSGRVSMRYAEFATDDAGVTRGRAVSLEAELRTSMGIPNQLELAVTSLEATGFSSDDIRRAIAPASTTGSAERVPAPSSTPARADRKRRSR